MSAQIITFPGSKVREEPINTGYPADWPYRIAGEPVDPPTDAFEYLELCKRFLEPDDYTDMLVSIMDRDAYDAMESQIKKLVDNYFWFLRR